ncbi:GON-4-like protein isoform X2 [Hydra vulgaris]|uniref:GON-4-like protein isoform X2 n=1 Tax=Hydra vulgaris TaxID=6087 RepID=UPI001F5E6219|nr:GON-4-like protein [Hydra vulgaris]
MENSITDFHQNSDMTTSYNHPNSDLPNSEIHTSSDIPPVSNNKRKAPKIKSGFNKRRRVENFANSDDSAADGDESDISDEYEIDWEKLEEELEESAAKANLTAINVKSILRHVLSDKRVLEYAQNAAGNSCNDIISKAKLTRSKAKLIGQPPLGLPSMETTKPTFLDLNFPETSSSDEEYKPQDDDDLSQVSEEESLYSDATFETSSPSQKASTPIHNLNEELSDTGVSDAGNITDSSEVINNVIDNDKESVFKVPAVPTDTRVCSSSCEEQIALRTRSKYPMQDIEVQEIEAMFQPPDSDALDFSVKDLDDPDEIIWKNWLADFMKPIKALNDTNDEQDEDFNYMAANVDEENEMEEELRNDKATRVTQKELQELFNELLLGYSHQNMAESINSEETFYTNNLAKIDAIPITEVAEDLYITFEQRQHIIAQMQQHVQLLTQIYMLSCTNSYLKNETQICKQYIEELALFHRKATENSINNVGHIQSDLSSFCVPGILDAHRIIKELDVSSIEPPKVHFRAKNPVYEVSKTVAEILCKEPYFSTFIELLPEIGMSEQKRDKNAYEFSSQRVRFSKFEDHLLAMGLEQFKRRGKYDLIAKHMLPTRTSRQLRCRVKNLLSRNEISNPVAVYWRDGYLPNIPVNDTIKLPREISTISLYKLPRRVWQGRLVPKWFNNNWREILINSKNNIVTNGKNDGFESEYHNKSALPESTVTSQVVTSQVVTSQNREPAVDSNLLKPFIDSCSFDESSKSIPFCTLKDLPQINSTSEILINSENIFISPPENFSVNSLNLDQSKCINLDQSKCINLDQSKCIPLPSTTVYSTSTSTINNATLELSNEKLNEGFQTSSHSTAPSSTPNLEKHDINMKTPDEIHDVFSLNISSEAPVVSESSLQLPYVSLIYTNNCLQTPEKSKDENVLKKCLVYTDLSLQTPQKCGVFTPQKINLSSEASDLSQLCLDSTLIKIDENSPPKKNSPPKIHEDKPKDVMGCENQFQNNINSANELLNDSNSFLCPHNLLSHENTSTLNENIKESTFSPENKFNTELNNEVKQDSDYLHDDVHLENSDVQTDKKLSEDISLSIYSLQNSSKLQSAEIENKELLPINTCSSGNSVSLNDKEVADILQMANLSTKQKVSQNKQKEIKNKPRKPRKVKEVFNFSEKLIEKGRDLTYIYLKRVKETLVGKPEIASQFHLIMQKLDTKELNRLDAYYRISNLFVDYPELIDNFAGFLEQHEARHVGKFLQWLSYEQVLRFHLCCEQAFVSQPGWYSKIIQKIVDVFEVSLNSKYIVDTITPMFKGNTALVHQFIKMFPDLSPPPFDDDDFEVIDFAAVKNGTKDIDDFEEILYHAETDENVTFQDDVRNKQNSQTKKGSSKFVTNKSNTNVTARKLSQLARKKKGSHNNRKNKSDNINCSNELNFVENVSSEDEGVKKITKEQIKINIPNCNEVQSNNRNQSSEVIQSCDIFNKSNQVVKTEQSLPDLSSNDIHFEIISSRANETVLSDSSQHSLCSVTKSQVVRETSLEQVDCQIIKNVILPKKDKAKRRLDKSELITLSNQTDLMKTVFSPDMSQVFDKESYSLFEREPVPQTPCLLTQDNLISNSLFDKEKSERSIVEVNNDNFDCGSCELTFPDTLYGDIKSSYDDLSFKGKIVSSSKLENSTTFEKPAEFINYTPVHTENIDVKPSHELLESSLHQSQVKSSQELYRIPSNFSSNFKSHSDNFLKSSKTLNIESCCNEEKQPYNLYETEKSFAELPVNNQSVIWKKEEDMVILTILQSLGDNENSFRKITETLESKSDAEVKNRIEFLLDMLNDSIQDDSNQSMSVDSDESN